MDVNLILFKKNGSRKAIPLPSKVAIIGRRRDCDLRIPLISVSRRHCQLILNNETLKVRDLGSRNGTFINGKRIEQEATATAGDKITIGPLTFGIQINGQPKDFISPKQPAQKLPPEEKPKAKHAAEKESESLEEIAINEKSDELPELDLKNDDDSFLDELEKL